VHRKGKSLLLIAQDQVVEIRNGSELLAKPGDVVQAEETIAFFDPFSEPIISEVEGTVKFEDILLGTTLKEEINEDTGKIEKKVTEYTLESLQPRIVVCDDNGEELATYHLPGAAYLNIDDGDSIKAGRILAKMLKESVKTRDITGGLPRVGELFEARRPKTPAVLSQIGGQVVFRGLMKGKRIIMVVDPFGKEYKHLVPMGKHLYVRDGDLVEAGEPLCEGSIDPHDILNILGENALQNFLVNGSI
jgi:DNA-directed RNA polymerase subunit beta'